MYALRDKESPDDGALTNYFRTIEEAEEARSHARRYDREGEHPGEEYLEIVEVERESRPCRFCGAEVQADDPRITHCRGCYYGGRVEEEERETQIAYFAERTGAEVVVEHTGGGCFWMAFRFEGEDDFYVATDGEASLPSLQLCNVGGCGERVTFDPEQGGTVCPNHGPNRGRPYSLVGGWGYVGRHSNDEESPDYEGTAIAGIFVGEYDPEKVNAYWESYPSGSLSNSEVVEAILRDREERKGKQTDDVLLDLVEKEWWERMQGELLVGSEYGEEHRDAELAKIVLDLAAHAERTSACVADMQLDAEGNEVPDDWKLTPEEMARRVVAALMVVFYGGS